MAYNIGDSVGFNVSFDYQGPAYNGAKLRCVVGIGGTWLGFDEKCWTEISILLGETKSWARFTQRVIVILKNLEMGKTYDAYVKLMPKILGQENLYWHMSNLIHMEAAAPDSEFRSLSVTVG